MVSQADKCQRTPRLTDAQRAIVNDNLWRAVAYVNKRILRPYGSPSVCDREDVFQEAFLALAKAVIAYDPLRHGEFGSFAWMRIRVAVHMALREKYLFIRVPIYKQQQAKRVLAAEEPRDFAQDRRSASGRYPRWGQREIGQRAEAVAAVVG